MGKKIVATATPDLNQALTAKLLGDAIKARRTQSQLRIEDAAALCGVAKQTLSNVEHGHSSTQFDTILNICNGLGIQLIIAPWRQNEGSDDWQ